MAPEKNECIPATVVMPAGAFLMGSEEGMDNEKPAHRVYVDGFALGKFPVTNREYHNYVAAVGASPPPFWQDPMSADPDKPVVGVSWHEPGGYCGGPGA